MEKSVRDFYAIISGRWVDVAYNLPTSKQSSLDTTCFVKDDCMGVRIDVCLMNNNAGSALSGCKVFRASGLPVHCHVTITMHIEPYNQFVLALVRPTDIPLDLEMLMSGVNIYWRVTLSVIVAITIRLLEGQCLCVML